MQRHKQRKGEGRKEQTGGNKKEKDGKPTKRSVTERI
jgi:hypothetical protein